MSVATCKGGHSGVQGMSVVSCNGTLCKLVAT